MFPWGKRNQGMLQYLKETPAEETLKLLIQFWYYQAGSHFRLVISSLSADADTTTFFLNCTLVLVRCRMELICRKHKHLSTTFRRMGIVPAGSSTNFLNVMGTSQHFFPHFSDSIRSSWCTTSMTLSKTWCGCTTLTTVCCCHLLTLHPTVMGWRILNTYVQFLVVILNINLRKQMKHEWNCCTQKQI
jgi:hypothetical protein